MEPGHPLVASVVIAHNVGHMQMQSSLIHDTLKGDVGKDFYVYLVFLLCLYCCNIKHCSIKFKKTKNTRIYFPEKKKRITTLAGFTL